MKKDIKDYLHLYLGCQCKGKEGSMIYTLQNVDLKSLPLLKDCYENECVIFDFKPILRPLSSITSDEETEISKLYFEFMETQYKGTRDCRMMAHITQWYLSKHFDLFGLIESGLAIDKTTLKPQP